jgi:hypothetical protein
MSFSMNRRYRRFVFKNIVGPLVVPIIWLLKRLYSLSFGWLDARASRAKEKKLEGEIREILPFLFTSYGGVVIANAGVPFPEPFDYATVSIACESLLLRFSRGRGEFNVDIARAKVPDSWHDLRLVLAAVNGSAECPERRRIPGLNEAAMLLEHNMARLCITFGADAAGEISHRLEEFDKADRAAMRQWEFEANRRFR